jgi:hypothetical protein
MTRRLLSAVTRAISPRPAHTDHVHFHQGARGNAAACFDARCDRPQLDVA